MSAPSQLSRRLPLILSAIVLAAVAIWTAHRLQFAAAHAGPAAIAFNRDICVECGMAVSDPRFAAQLRLASGRTLNFDDPGCLMTYLAEHHPPVRHMWFHAFQGDRWLSPEQVRFLPVAQSPTGYGFAAVPAGTPGSLSGHQFAARVAALNQQRREAP